MPGKSAWTPWDRTGGSCRSFIGYAAFYKKCSGLDRERSEGSGGRPVCRDGEPAGAQPPDGAQHQQQSAAAKDGRKYGGPLGKNISKGRKAHGKHLRSFLKNHPLPSGSWRTGGADVDARGKNPVCMKAEYSIRCRRGRGRCDPTERRFVGTLPIEHPRQAEPACGKVLPPRVKTLGRA